MDKEDVARKVLASVGGAQNVLTNTVCMTRLRITLQDPQIVDYMSLGNVKGVLGTSVRGQNGLEIVFGPRVIEDIYEAFITLTGKEAGSDALFPMTRRRSNMHVQINTQRSNMPTSSTSGEFSFINDADMTRLEDIFGKKAESDTPKPLANDWRLLVLNGPNINMLGMGACAHEGKDDYAALLELCKQTSEEVGFVRCDCFQSNHEGDLVDKIQEAFFLYEAIIINPGAYGASAALREALRAAPIPAIEVHLFAQRELDEVGVACVSTVDGLEVDGYRKAIIAMAQHLNRQ